MSNIVGLNLDIDDDYLAEAIKNTVMTGIVETLDKDKIVSGLVNTVLETKVDEKGCISSYRSDNKYTLLEVYVNQMIRDIVKEEMKKIVEEKRPKMQEIIRKELNKKANINKFVDSFIDSTSKTLDNDWETTINIYYEKKDEEW